MFIKETRIPLMRKSAAALLVLALSLVCRTDVSGQPAPGTVRGQVIDGSGGVLPGAPARAADEAGRVVSTAETDGAGGYILRALPAGAITLTFQLDGFASVSVPVTVLPGGESRVVE